MENKQKPVLLIYPPYRGRLSLKSRPPFPLGPLYIASYLEENGIQSRVMDFSYLRWNEDSIYFWLKENLKKYNKVIGVSSLMSTTYEGAYIIINLIKRIDSKRRIVLGGPHATLFPDHVKKHSKADYICFGEGEQVFLSFLKGEENEGIVKMSEIQKRIDRTQFVENLDELPFPQRRLLLDGRELKEMYVTFTRGCPHRCSFCGSHLIQGRKWRYKEVKTVLDEIRFYVREWKVKRFIVEDDNLSAGKKGIEWLKEVCRGIIKNFSTEQLYFRVSHGIPVYATADKELCDLMWAAGFRKMVFPLESSNEEVLRDMRKGRNVVENWKKAMSNWEYEKHRPVEIILGYPFTETITSMLKTMADISFRKGVIWASHFRLNRGIELYDRCRRAGYIEADPDPKDATDFFIETRRFNIQDLKELMRISKGINFGIVNNDFDIFSDHLDKSPIVITRKRNVRLDDCVAEGNFSFKKAQDIFVGMLLLREGKIRGIGKPKLFFGRDNKDLFFEKMESSSVYRTLNILFQNVFKKGGTL